MLKLTSEFLNFLMEVQKLTVTLVCLPAGDEDALHRHDVRGRGEQRAVRPVLQAARRRGPLSGGGLEALQVRQEQPGQDEHSGRGVKAVRLAPEERETRESELGRRVWLLFLTSHLIESDFVATVSSRVRGYAVAALQQPAQESSRPLCVSSPVRRTSSAFQKGEIVYHSNMFLHVVHKLCKLFLNFSVFLLKECCSDDEYLST